MRRLNVRYSDNCQGETDPQIPHFPCFREVPVKTEYSRSTRGVIFTVDKQHIFWMRVAETDRRELGLFKRDGFPSYYEPLCQSSGPF
jgi:hypothetical protein